LKRTALILTLILALSFLAVTGRVCVNAAENSWVEKQPMHTARFSFGVAVVNGKIYAIGGAVATQSRELTAANEEYDPVTDVWTEKAPMPTARYGCAVVAYENKIYVFGGGANDSNTNRTEVYDPAANTWTIKASMPTARILLQANVVGDKIYLIGGYDERTLNEVYDPATDTWTTKAPIPTGVVAYVSAVVDNKIYVIGGGFSNLTRVYDTKTDTWSSGAPIPTPVSGACVGAITDVKGQKAIYVVGGETDIFSPQNLTQVYLPGNNSWSIGASLRIVRSRLCAAVVNDRLYAIGGTRAVIHLGLTDNEQYIPFGYFDEAPSLRVLSPENKTYTESDVPLTFALNESAVWMGYVLDGQAPVSISSNITLAGLSSGLHNVTVYASNTFGDMGASETITFTVAVPELFPTTLAIVALVLVAVVGIGLLVYFKKRKP
jgi:N-acetylneuraminic acid mutarotase